MLRCARRVHRGVIGLIACVGFAATELGTSSVARASEDLTRIQDVFRDAIRRATPATVVCRPTGARSDRAGFSSGVLVHPRGLILSDGDAGLVWEMVDGRLVKSWQDQVTVRLVGMEGAPSRAGVVIARDRDVDSSLIELREVGPKPYPFVPLGRSADLRVGDFALALGTTFDDEGITPPTLTAGLVSAITARTSGGLDEERLWIFTSAAINQGVNGGPLIDLEGRLVGTVSTYLDPEPDEPHPYLGKAVPVDRLRATFASRPEMADVIAVATDVPARDAGVAGAMESAMHRAAMRAWPSVVSLEVKRSAPVRGETLLDDAVVTLPRWTGPITAYVADDRGHLVTSLHNLTNLADRARPTWTPPPGADHETGLKHVLGATAHLADGRSVAAQFVGYDVRSGIGVFALDPSAVPHPQPLVPAGTTALRRGRFVLVVGNPYGASRPPQPLLTMGVLGKVHDARTAAPWRGQWQTDAAVLDTSAGGPALDVEGHVLGLSHLWHPARHGRGSGIAFIVPQADVERALADVLAGRTAAPGVFGVWFAPGPHAIVSRTLPNSAAAAAGVAAGDRIVALDGLPIATSADARNLLLQRYAGEEVTASIERGGTVREVNVVLTPREPE